MKTISDYNLLQFPAALANEILSVADKQRWCNLHNKKWNIYFVVDGNIVVR